MKNYVALKEVQTDLKTGAISCVQLVEQYIQKIGENAHLNAFLEVFNESALAKAKEVDEKLKNGSAGVLAGAVIGLKDNICYKGHKVSAASKILEGFESMFSSTVTERLLQEDAIIIGRLNCDEFAMGSSNENSAYGCVANGIDSNYVSGGSSGGPAVAVQMGLCLASFGSDTGGSIRQPASFCGIVGLKPTYGRVSRHGLIAYASSFDQIGPFTRTVADAALLLEVIAGADEFDTTASQKPVGKYTEEVVENKPKRIAYIKQCIESEGLDPEIKTHLTNLIQELKDKGHTVEAVDYPYLDYMVPTYYVLTTAEASGNLARFDGVHFGHRSELANDVESTYVLSRSEGFGDEVQRRIMLGTFVLSAGFYDAYYSKAQKIRRILRDKTKEIFSQYDFILTPTCPSTAFKIGENIDDPITMYLQDIFTVQANLTGVPSVSVPRGTHSNGLPFGVQLMADEFQEGPMLAFAESISVN
ncbi:MAG: Asp-tRNA(Asn)/Glu-tRNA(Gln) amidotransferase subunit GatA [Flavobacteriales bacterium]|nr:Asp-tRNA(Asn)/Glu-tRNA(Gln) amidotransferase subunit GatA [Flavobacteriales bacterium]